MAHSMGLLKQELITGDHLKLSGHQSVKWMKPVSAGVYLKNDQTNQVMQTYSVKCTWICLWFHACKIKQISFRFDSQTDM